MPRQCFNCKHQAMDKFCKKEPWTPNRANEDGSDGAPCPDWEEYNGIHGTK